jgi:hypothetical protein
MAPQADAAASLHPSSTPETYLPSARRDQGAVPLAVQALSLSDSHDMRPAPPAIHEFTVMLRNVSELVTSKQICDFMEASVGQVACVTVLPKPHSDTTNWLTELRDRQATAEALLHAAAVDRPQHWLSSQLLFSERSTAGSLEAARQEYAERDPYAPGAAAQPIPRGGCVAFVTFETIEGARRAYGRFFQSFAQWYCADCSEGTPPFAASFVAFSAEAGMATARHAADSTALSPTHSSPSSPSPAAAAPYTVSGFPTSSQSLLLPAAEVPRGPLSSPERSAASVHTPVAAASALPVLGTAAADNVGAPQLSHFPKPALASAHTAHIWAAEAPRRFDINWERLAASSTDSQIGRTVLVYVLLVLLSFGSTALITLLYNLHSSESADMNWYGASWPIARPYSASVHAGTPQPAFSCRSRLSSKKRSRRHASPHF